MGDMDIFGSIPVAFALYLVFFVILFIFTILYMIYMAMKHLDDKKQRLEEIERDRNRPPLPPPPHTK